MHNIISFQFHSHSIIWPIHHHNPQKSFWCIALYVLVETLEFLQAYGRMCTKVDIESINEPKMVRCV